MQSQSGESWSISNSPASLSSRPFTAASLLCSRSNNLFPLVLGPKLMLSWNACTWTRQRNPHSFSHMAMRTRTWNTYHMLSSWRPLRWTFESFSLSSPYTRFIYYGKHEYYRVRNPGFCLILHLTTLAKPSLFR